jgi:hypothetical protein
VHTHTGDFTQDAPESSNARNAARETPPPPSPPPLHVSLEQL